MSDNTEQRAVVAHDCPSCKCQPHHALLDWTDRDKSTVQTWIGTCACGWRGTPFTTWMGAMSEAESHVYRERRHPR